MMPSQRDDQTWDTLLWFAETFGWSPSDLESLPAEHGKQLIRAWNRKMRRSKQAQRKAQAKRRI